MSTKHSVTAATIDDGSEVGTNDWNATHIETLHTDISVGTETHDIDYTDGGTHDLTLTGNPTFTLSNAASTGTTDIRLILRQDGTGSRTVTWPGSVTWVDGQEPTLQTAANAIDIVGLVSVDSGTNWLGFHDQVQTHVTHDWNYVSGSADVTISSTSFTDVDNNLDCTVAAVAGDTLEITPNLLVASDAAGQAMIFTAEMVTSGNIVDNGTTTQGPSAWYASNINDSGAAGPVSGSAYYTVVSGDISGGNVQVRLQARLTTAGSRDIYRNSWGIQFAVKNLGQ